MLLYELLEMPKGIILHYLLKESKISLSKGNVFAASKIGQKIEGGYGIELK